MNGIKKVTKEQLADIHARYKGGEPLNEIAKTYKLRYATVRYYCQSHKGRIWTNEWIEEADYCIIRLAHYGEHKADLKVDYADRPLLRGYRWRIGSNGYPVTNVENVPTELHRVLATAPDGLVTDHIDRDKTNNRRSNLRYVTHSENLLNSAVSDIAAPKKAARALRKKTRGTITWIEPIQKYKVLKGTVYLGCYPDIESSEMAIDAFMWWKALPEHQPPRGDELLRLYVKHLLMEGSLPVPAV